MGPPRKMPSQPSSSTTSTQYDPSQLPTSSRSTPLDTQIPAGVALGMSPASRYQHNLKVLRKRDPSIMSIFDQFSHVCIYHHDGSKWSKHGYEGTMFLFERNSYPPYGFYVLNRNGLDDYIQGIYPEDQCLPSGEFLIIRSYPDFLARRLASIPPTPSGESPDPFSDAYAIPNIDEIDPKKRGRPEVIGLWMLTVNSRDTLTEVMQRLHSYIKRNEHYPEEFRYGPGRPPPPHRLRAVPRSQPTPMSDTQRQSDSENDQGNHSDAPSHMSGGMSEVERLFDKLRKPAAPTPAPAPSTTGTNLTMESLFAAAAADRQDNVPVSPSTSSTGLALLDSIFASAAPSSTPATQPILSPQPTTTAPQVLTQDVLSNLLGLPPTRTASAASTTFSTSASAVSHPSSREGDNEDDDESDSPGDFFPPRPVSNVARTAGSELLSTLGLGGPRLAAHGKINGDVTPRGPLNGQHQGQHPVRPAAISVETTTSVSTVRGDAPTATAPEGNGKPRANRPLVPFEPDSEYWPYTRGPIVEQSPTDGTSDNDIVEISFEETSMLSDPAEFDKAVKHQRSAVSLKSAAANGTKQPNGHTSAAHGSGVEEASATGKGKNRRKTKKELREAANAKAREEIERSWDMPVPSPAANKTQHLVHEPPSPISSPEPAPRSQRSGSAVHLAPEMKTPTMNGNAILGQINGATNYYTPSPHKSKGKGAAAVNGKAKAVNGHSQGVGLGVDADAVTNSVVAALDSQPRPALAGKKMEKSEFVKEVLLLIHTDKAFVDTLYQEYMTRFA
ncbi:hypothetical protein CVT26_007935 [Gymnopilus dilepis]|uniref:mRNA-decapping enzyme C-terminal domain-containing protein n=1 Tax=Gymnopilus dilepis TaxID=231916 RepID=A0A409W854_9AGAR|nr:hypothetical protein CVT26_007935 [Gymnopilus dilepis]